MTAHRSLYLQKTKAFSLVALTALMMSACATPGIDLVRQAQDNYNRATQLDNQAQLFSDYKVEAVDIRKRASISSMYNLVLSSIGAIKPETVEQLKKDGLWGNLLTIKSISEWRLGRYAQAAESAQEALKFNQSTLPRDQALNEVMPQLIRNDQAKNFVDLKALGGQYSYQDWLINVQEPLQKVLSDLPGESVKWRERGRIQIATYLKMNEIIALINLRDGFVKLNPCATSQPPTSGDCLGLESQLTSPNSGSNELAQYAELLLKATGEPCTAKNDPVLQQMLKKFGAELPVSLRRDC